MKLFATLMMVFLTINAAAASDIRDTVKNRSRSDLVRVIDPDKMIFGIPFGTSEDDFIKKYGRPVGYIQISQTDSGMLYGTKHLFLFEDQKLTGVRISHNIVDWKISRAILSGSEFDKVRWRLNNGIELDMNRAAVKKILGDRLLKDGHGYQYYYETDKSRVELDFSHYVGSGENDDAYTLHGVMVRKR